MTIYLSGEEFIALVDMITRLSFDEFNAVCDSKELCISITKVKEGLKTVITNCITKFQD